MKLISFIFILLLSSSAFAQQSVVVKYRAKYPTPLGAENTVKLLREVAAEVKGGILRKTTGNNCRGYSCDIICFSNGQHYDVLIDSDDRAIPGWNFVGLIDPSRCELVMSQPVPDPDPVEPDPKPEEPKPEVDSILNLLRIISLQIAQLNQNQTEQTESLQKAIESLKAEIEKGIKVRF
jgi:hypothetical protein